MPPSFWAAMMKQMACHYARMAGSRKEKGSAIWTEDGWMDSSLECGQQRLQSRYALPTAEVSLLVIGALHLIRHEERQKGVDR